MSSPGDERPDREALDRLAGAVDAVVDRLRGLEEGLRRAEERNAELSELLDEFRAGEEDPEELAGRAERLAGENERLRERLQEGRETVERILARIRFLEEQR